MRPGWGCPPRWPRLRLRRCGRRSRGRWWPVLCWLRFCVPAGSLRFISNSLAIYDTDRLFFPFCGWFGGSDRFGGRCGLAGAVWWLLGVGCWLTGRVEAFNLVEDCPRFSFRRTPQGVGRRMRTPRAKGYEVWNTLVRCLLVEASQIAKGLLVCYAGSLLNDSRFDGGVSSEPGAKNLCGPRRSCGRGRRQCS